VWTSDPRDTSHVVLPAGVLALAEILAQHAHDVWAAARWREGWRFGEKRDEQLKHTPNMVPYHQLPSQEQQYDRDLALETLKLLTVLGYKLEEAQP
jgi:hypothetical protein